MLKCVAWPAEEQNRGKPNWEHLNEDLHVLITVEDAQNRAEIKLKRAVEEVKKLLVPAAEGEDSLKKMQLMELAILNGTYRDANIKSRKHRVPPVSQDPNRHAQRDAPPHRHPSAPGPESGLIYAPYEYPYTLAPATSILEYPIDSSGVLASSKNEDLSLYFGFHTCAVATKVRRHDLRVHPYQRIVTADRAATGN
ncbi:hypothetical protein ANANG_G00304920 [Anguilla anguilla]|uniref:Protein quaking putative nuclear localisation signal domain-containing protein n=1 Tax=Anguilla anguilla TaxID=7936 RepID=A0A9D3RII4_ANGAN|nr:hypothetical protein ANANG_G00304920 [Anguilla anguilla]